MNFLISSSSSAARLLPRTTTWTCRRCISSGPVPPLPRKPRRKLYVLGGLALGAAGAQATGVIDGGHYLRAAERAARVGKGLALCIHEYAPV